MAPKRSREEDGDIKALTMKLKGLKRTREDVDFSRLSWLLSRMEKPAARTFKCKTCDREFDSFQALGGHRASHSAKSDDPLKNRKIHVCKKCGAEFAKGQALGGHMRKHRETSPSPTTSEEMSSDLTPRVDVAVSNVLNSKEISSSKRVRSLDIDLNFVPSEELDEEDYQPLEDSKLNNYDVDENNSKLNHDEESEEEDYSKSLEEEDYSKSEEEDYQPLEDSKLKNYDVDENNSKLNHDEESEEEDYSKSLEEENYPTENYSKLKNYELDENDSMLKHDDLPIEEEKLINEWKYKKINLEPLALQERDLNIKYYYFLDE